MAKSAGAKSKHTHVPSHIGFSVIGLVALVFGLLVAINYNAGSDTPTVESHASTVNTTTKQCISYNTSGKCLLYQTTTTVVNTKTPCLTYNTSGQCVYYQGTTQNTTTFVPTVATKKPATSQQQPTANKPQKNYGQSSSCSSMGGFCQSMANNPGGGSFHAGLCPGPSSWQCFIPNKTGPAVVNTYGPGLLTCQNGKAVAVGGGAYNESRTQLTHICALNPNTVFVGANKYTCSTVPAAYKYLCN